MIPQAEINDVEFLIDLQELLTHNIKALCGIEDKGFRQGVYIIVHSVW